MALHDRNARRARAAAGPAGSRHRSTRHRAARPGDAGQAALGQGGAGPGGAGTSGPTGHAGEAASAWRWAAPVGAAVAAALLGWEATHGGIQSHHLLADPTLPSVSNAWGAVILPALGALATHFVRRRAARSLATSGQPQRVARRALLGSLAALAVGLALSAAFTLAPGDASAAVFLTAAAAGLLVPTYRAEYAFGFVIGMAFTFGPVLPLIATLLLAGTSAIAHYLLRPLAAGAYRRLRPA